MTNSVDATIGIVSYGRESLLKLCLDSLTKQTVKPKKVIVLISGYTDKSLALLKRFKNVEWFKVKGRVHIPQARNIILNLCKTKIISFLDDDVVADPSWLESVVKSFTNDKIAGVTGPTINCDQTLAITAKITTTSKNLNYITPWGEVRGGSYRWIPPNPVKCQTMIGANMSYVTKELKKVGGFDEELGVGPDFREDSGPQIPLIKKGFHFIYCPTAKVLHIREAKGGIRSDDPSEYFYWCGRNHRVLVDKHFPKLLTRLSWVFWSVSPPCLWLALLLTILRRENYLKWHVGLWNLKQEG